MKVHASRSCKLFLRHCPGWHIKSLLNPFYTLKLMAQRTVAWKNSDMVHNFSPISQETLLCSELSLLPSYPLPCLPTLYCVASSLHPESRRRLNSQGLSVLSLISLLICLKFFTKTLIVWLDLKGNYGHHSQFLFVYYLLLCLLPSTTKLV